MTQQALNITTNIRAIENIKSEILGEVSKLYIHLSDFEDTDIYDKISGSIATIVAMDYILARRLGIDFGSVDQKISELTAMAAQDGHELEIAFSDMSELKSHINSRLRR